MAESDTARWAEGRLRELLGTAAAGDVEALAAHVAGIAASAAAGNDETQLRCQADVHDVVLAAIVGMQEVAGPSRGSSAWPQPGEAPRPRLRGPQSH